MTTSSFQELSNDLLLQKTKGLVSRERGLQAHFLEALREIDRRKLYRELRYSSLFEFMIQELKYSAGAAQRRIDAARLAQAVPEVISKVQDGSVNLMTLARVQSVLKAEERAQGERLSAHFKSRLLDRISGKSVAETDQILFRVLPEAAAKVEMLKKESLRQIDAESSRLSILIDNDLRMKLERVKEISSTKAQNFSLAAVLNLLADDYLKRHDPVMKAERALGVSRKSGAKESLPSASPEISTDRGSRQGPGDQNSFVSLGKERLVETTSTVEVRTSGARIPLPAKLRHLVFQRDQGRCQKRDPRNGEICGSRHFIEIDHILPVAKGGKNEERNLRCVCRSHHRLFTDQAFGSNWIRQKISESRDSRLQNRSGPRRN